MGTRTYADNVVGQAAPAGEVRILPEPTGTGSAVGSSPAAGRDTEPLQFVVRRRSARTARSRAFADPWHIAATPTRQRGARSTGRWAAA